MQTSKKPSDTIVTYEEGLKESIVFREKFSDWVEGGATLNVKQQTNVQSKDREWKVYDRGSCNFFFF